jgi:hypothetical protein
MDPAHRDAAVKKGQGGEGWGRMSTIELYVCGVVGESIAIALGFIEASGE